MKQQITIMKGMRFLWMIFLVLMISSITYAQTSSIDLSSERQTIRGFGGMNFPRWIGDLSSTAVDRAFGTGSGQIGLTILRISVPPNQSDWSGEVPTAQRAKNHGAIVFATPWSPPASMKTNGNTTGGSLSTSQYSAYANYLRDFCDYMSSNGASLYAISVQNEPDYVPDYESCGWTSSQMRTFLNNNASVIPVRVIAPETVHPKSDWYNALSSASQLDIYADHLYGGGPTDFNKEHWMTEHYTNSSISGNQWPEALDAGIEINSCMANDYNAYIWWYIRRSYGLLDENNNVTKRGYVMSHFSKFVRPNYVRINATYSPTSNVTVTAYTSGSTIVIVAINRNSSSRTINFSFSGDQATNFTKYETTSSSNVANRGTISGGSSMSHSLAGYSISTFVGTIGGSSGGGDEHVWLEAECGTVGSMWNTPSDGNASNDEYVTIQSGNNSTSSAPTSSSAQISLPFSVDENGNYIVWGRVIAPTGNDDSFWIRMDSGSWVKWNNIASGSSWHWDEVHNADNNNQVVTYNLGSGSHTLTVAYREDGTQLDKIYITNSGDTPSGEGSAATNCGGAANDPPVANAGSDQTVTDSDNSGSESVTLNGSGSNDPDGTIISYVWRESGNQIASGVTPSVSLTVGTHTIALTVTDNDGATDTDDVTITVNAGTQNQPPVANAGSDQTVTDSDNNGSQSVTLNGSGSNDSDGTITSYVWTEGGSQIATGVNPTVSLSVGTHNITLTVTDNDGATDTDGVIVTVNAGSSGGEEHVWLEAECGTVGSLWNTPSDGNASNDEYVTIQSGNNSTSSAPTSTSAQIALPFSVGSSGSYIVWGRVIAPSYTDDSFWIRIDSESWVKWNNIASGSSWHWDEVHNADNNNQVVTYNLGSGSHTLTVAYREDGTQLDKIYITNSGDTPSGEGSAATNCGGATNDPPVANAGSDQTVTDSDNNGSQSVTLNGSGSSDSDGTITSYVWNEGGSQIATGVNPTVSLSVGTHNITLTVTDNDGATDADDVTITVNAGSSGGGTDIWLEAECGTVGSLWNINSDGNASNDEYVTIQSGSNSTTSPPTSSSSHITYTFNLSESDTYVLWARVITPSPNDDSFWIRMDGGSWYQWNNIGPASSWSWEQCQSYSLSSGNHTLTVAYREDGARLDKINITNSGDTPSGEGSAASNCGIGKPIADNELIESKTIVPSEFVLEQNYPNPFNPVTEISFEIPENMFVSLKVYDALGEEITELAGQRYDSGRYTFRFNAVDLPSGMYFYTIKAGKFTSTKKMLLIR